MKTNLITPEVIRKILDDMPLRDIITTCALAHILIRERGAYLALTGDPRRFAVYKSSNDKLGYLDVLPDYSTAWYPIPRQPAPFDIPATQEEQ
jgi:hypothetical protein